LGEFRRSPPSAFRTARLRVLSIKYKKAASHALDTLAVLVPGLDAGGGELDASGAIHEVPGEGGVLDDVVDEFLPLDFEGVVEVGGVGDFLPLVAEPEGLLDVGIPHGVRVGTEELNPAFAEAGDG
jgi:hypothetical protein